MTIFQKITNEGKAFHVGSSPYKGEKAHTFFACVADSFDDLHSGTIVGRSYYTDPDQMAAALLEAYTKLETIKGY